MTVWSTEYCDSANRKNNSASVILESWDIAPMHYFIVKFWVSLHILELLSMVLNELYEMPSI